MPVENAPPPLRRDGSRPGSPRSGNPESEVSTTGEAPKRGEVGTTGVAEQVLSLRAEHLLRQPCRLDLSFAAAPAPARSAFERALRVADAEPLFEALESWLDVSFDVTPFDDESSGPDGSPNGPTARSIDEPAPLRLRLAHRANASPALTLHLPRRALGFLPPIPDAVSSRIDIRLVPLSAICRVARLSLSADELARLTPGAVLLLPDTFGGGWPVRLAARGIAAEARLETAESALDVPSGVLVREKSPPSSGATPGDAPHRVDVVLDAVLPWDPVAVLGGAGPSRVQLPASLPHCRFRGLVDGRKCLVGHVARLGDGYGFFALERVGELSPSGPPDTGSD